MSDGARKRTLADWVVKTKKQVVKLYAITKWARDAETVQKCMASDAFLSMLCTSYHFPEYHCFPHESEPAIRRCHERPDICKRKPRPCQVQDHYTPSRLSSRVPCRRLRNHDLLTSLDVLTTGTYQRLPSAIKVFSIFCMLGLCSCLSIEIYHSNHSLNRC